MTSFYISAAIAALILMASAEDTARIRQKYNKLREELYSKETKKNDNKNT